MIKNADKIVALVMLKQLIGDQLQKLNVQEEAYVGVFDLDTNTVTVTLAASQVEIPLDTVMRSLAVLCGTQEPANLTIVKEGKQSVRSKQQRRGPLE
jgi:prolyl-tRNA editing enzyme YbaK/EbsC (Cys-tRNA(Pro) deacylase)